MKKIWIGVIAGGTAFAGSMLTWQLTDQASGQDRPGAIADGLPPSKLPADAKVAARVNGKPIYAAEVDAITAARLGEAGRDPVEELIDRQLLLQEGHRLGLAPSKAEVDAAVKTSRASTEEPGGEQSKALLEAYLRKQGMGWEDYWSSDTVHAAWRDTLIIARAREAIKAKAATPQEALRSVEKRLDELRSAAVIERTR